MLAHPTPAQAFPRRAQTLTQYAAAHPVWQAWRTAATVVWTARATLDAPGLVVGRQIFRGAAWTLDHLYTHGPADVGIWRQYGPALTATWQMQRDFALHQPGSTPTQTIRLGPAAQGGLTALTHWDPILGHRVPPSAEQALLAVCHGVRLAAAPNPVGSGAPGIMLVALTTQDTLMGLATRYLGHPAAWPQLRELNHLRAPYLSDRLWDQYGPPVAAWELTAGSGGSFVAAPLVAAGATTVTLPGVGAPSCPPGSRIVLEQWTAAGRQQEVHAVQTFDANTHVATLAEAVQQAYGPGALLGLNGNPALQTTQVLAPGDTIQIPLTGPPTTTLLTDPADAFGTDWAVDANGFLAWTDTGDLATASGVANLQGALIRRVNSALGTLPLHPYTYGSGLPSVVGLPMGESHVIRGFVTTVLQQDPRVTAVESVTVTSDGTTWHVHAQVLVRGLPQAVPLITQFIAA